jgi:hypothetical protein
MEAAAGTAAQDASKAAPAASSWASRWWAFPVGLFVGTRAGMVLFSYLTMSIYPNIHQGGRDLWMQSIPSLDGLLRWDSGWFKQLALQGYDPAIPETSNFWPLLPMLTRAVVWLTGLNVNFALLIVANAAGLAALLLVYKIYLRFASVDEARTGLLVFAAFPFHFFQATGYPESMMVAFSAGAILAAMEMRHVLGGALLGLGTLSRHITILLGVGLLAVQWRQRGKSVKDLVLNWRFLALGVPFLFVAGFMVFEYYTFNDPLAFWRIRDKWGSKAWYSVTQAEDLRHYSYIAAAIVPTIGTLGCLWKKEWRELGAAAAPLMFVLWYAGLEGLGRYSASVWPAFLPLGVWLARRPEIQSGWLGMSYLLQGLFFWLFCHQFPIN